MNYAGYAATDSAIPSTVDAGTLANCNTLTKATILPQVIVVILVIIVLVLVTLSWFWRRTVHDTPPTTAKVKQAGYFDIGAMILLVGVVVAAIWGVVSATRARNGCEIVTERSIRATRT